jgi:hemerythrin
MALMAWSDKLSVGVDSIDDQHKKLLSLLNQLHDGMMAGKGKDILGGILKGLVDYTVTHFRYEEQLFARTGYPESEEHKNEHAELVRKVEEIQRQYATTGAKALTIPVMNFLKDWLSLHIVGTDKRYAPHLIAKGVL